MPSVCSFHHACVVIASHCPERAEYALYTVFGGVLSVLREYKSVDFLPHALDTARKIVYR